MKKEYKYNDSYPLSVLLEVLPGWYEENHRDLPWRGTGDPYDVWLSEIMLQQTRVAAVISYFLRFKKELPDIASLAVCGEERLLKLWEGLGYYSRVRNLQRAAREVMSRCGGALPQTAAELQKLPGIGSYTAGAIASIAFGEAVPAVDGNVLRICSRISGNTDDIALPETKKALERQLSMVFHEACRQKEQAAEESREAEDAARRVFSPGIVNQAMMELGATICVPNGPPQCGQCPVKEACFAFARGLQSDLPVKTAKKPRRIERRTIFVITEGDACLIRKRPAKGLLAGLWELPSKEGHLTEREALTAVKQLLSESEVKPAGGRDILHIKKLPPAKHIFTHIEWQMEAYLVKVVPAVESPGMPEGDSLKAAPAERPEGDPLKTAPAERPEGDPLKTAPEERPEGDPLKTAPEERPEGDPLKRTPAEVQEVTRADAPGAARPGRALVFADEAELTGVYSLPSAFAAYLPVIRMGEMPQDVMSHGIGKK